MISTSLLHFEDCADGLARHGFSIIDNFLTGNEIDDILKQDEFRNNLMHFKKAGIGNTKTVMVNEAVRGDYISWINPESTGAGILRYVEKLKGLMAYLNQNLFLSLKDVELHLTSYPIGSFYKRHLDQFKQDDHRKISVILYLNDNWLVQDGGQLRIYDSTTEIDVLPLAGRMVCMRSDLIEHEVLPANRERLSVTGWMLDQYIDVK